MNANEFTGELFLDDTTPPELGDFQTLEEEVSDQFEVVEDEAYITSNHVYKRVFFKYRDLTSLPHKKNKCVKWSYPWSGAKICTGWKTQYRWIYRIGYIRIESINKDGVKSALEQCFKVTAITAALAAVASGGSAAAATAEVVLKECLVSKLGDRLVSVSVRVKSVRGDWE